jgi:hypothetical protein
VSDLYIGMSGRPVATAFHLLGHDEDDLTRAFAWTLGQSDHFMRRVLDALGLPFATDPVHRLDVQRPKVSLGRTDIEIVAAESLVIFEAKLGWNLPPESQVAKYEKRILEQIVEMTTDGGDLPVAHGAIVTLSECSREWASMRLSTNTRSLPYRHLTWQDVIALADETANAGGSLHQRQLLRDLANYLRSTTTMRDDPASQMTWIVPTNRDIADGSRLDFIETVQAGWYYNKVTKVPKGAFNFIAFRWGSALREIRYVRSRRIFTDPREALPAVFENHGAWEEHVLFELGPPIEPPKPLPYGKLYASGYHRALLDCLLTSETVVEARDRSYQRFADAGLRF